MNKPDKLKTLVIKSDPKMIDTIINHVANGGSILELCKTWNISFSAILKEIRSDDSTSKAYDQALKDRDEWAKERILNEVKSLSLFNIKDVFNPDGTMKRPADLPNEFTAAIKEITKDGDIKFQDKLKALDMLGKQMGLFVDKKEISGTISLERLINEANAIED